MKGRFSSPTLTVRSLFYHRAGKGVPAKVFMLFWAAVTLDPQEK